MKKKISLFLIMLLTAVMCSGFTYNEEKQRVFDYADVLSDVEGNELEQLCKENSIADKADYVIVTINDAEGSTSQEYADDFFDYNGFGYDKEMGDGTLFLLDFDNGKVTLSTSGKCNSTVAGFTEDILDSVDQKLENDDYNEACKSYIEECSYYINNSGSREDDGIFSHIWLNLIIGIVVGAIVTLILGYQQKSKMTVESSDYSSNVHVNPSKSHDIFIRTVTTKTKKEKDNDTHTSSSGNSHGGGSHDL